MIEHKGSVAIVPVLDEDQIVMVKQFRQPTGKVLLEIPAGTLDRAESAEECARRELTEETGYACGKISLMFSTYLSPGYSNEMMHTFLATELTPASAELDDDEFVEIVTVKLENAVDMIQRGEIEDAKTVCGLLMAQRIMNGRFQKADQ